MRGFLASRVGAAVVVPFALSVSCLPSSEEAANSGAPDGAARDVAAEAQCRVTDVPRPSPSLLTCPWVSNARFAWGQEVPVVAAEGDPPSPLGGPLTPGFYVLVSKSLFGAELSELDLLYGPNIDQEIGSGWVREAAFISCTTIDTLYATSSEQDPVAAGETCRALSPRALPLWELSYSDINGSLSENVPGQVVSYTASGDEVTLISAFPVDQPFSFGIMGSYAVVERFVLASAFNPLTTPGTTRPWDGSSMPFAPGERDPRCPPNPPAEGDPCDPDPVPLQCEYGGDAWGRCTTVASCTLMRGDGGGAFQFDVSKGRDCPPNPAACPSDFATALSLVDGDPDAAPTAVDAASLAGPACNYDEGVCGYGVYGNMLCGWSCRRRADVGTACPQLRPLAGMPCTGEGPSPGSCPYGQGCAPALSFGPDMTCQYGHWQILDDIGTCVPEACPQNRPDL